MENKSFIMRFIENEGDKLDRIAKIVKTPNRSETIRYLINEFLDNWPSQANDASPQTIEPSQS